LIIAQDVNSDVDGVLWWFEILAVFPGAVLWVLWVFATRGGLSYRIVGLALVRRDGRLAGRVRCFGRALLVWAPLCGMLFLSLRLDDRFWALWDGTGPEWMAWLSSILWWSALLLVIGYVFLALRYPARSLHDWLAGTYVVPR